MKEIVQARAFYDSLDRQEREELHQVLAEDIFFLEESLQQKILALLHQIDPGLSEEISKRNSFTTN